MTVGEIKETLKPTYNDVILFRPTRGHTFIELDSNLVNKAFDEITIKIDLCLLGNKTDFTATEKVLFELFIEHGRYFKG